MKPTVSVVRTAAELGALAKEILSDQKAGDESQTNSLVHYRDAGEKLRIAKLTVEPGKWESWLGRIGINPRRAQRFMRIANNWNQIMRKSDSAVASSNNWEFVDPEMTATEALSALSKASDDESSGASEPEFDLSEIPERLRPIFESLPLFAEAIKVTRPLVKAWQAVEASPAFQVGVKGKRHTLWSTKWQSCLSQLKSTKPKRLCPNGCATNKPSPDADVCSLCEGKGYQTEDDADERFSGV